MDQIAIWLAVAITAALVLDILIRYGRWQYWAGYEAGRAFQQTVLLNEARADARARRAKLAQPAPSMLRKAA